MLQRELRVDDFKFTIEVKEGRRTLGVSAPIKLGFPSELVGSLLLCFDQSHLCAPGQEGDRIEARSRIDRRRFFDLISLPLAPDVPRKGVEARARYVLRRSLKLLNLELVQLREHEASTQREQTTSDHRRASVRPRPHRIHASQRGVGQAGVIA